MRMLGKLTFGALGAAVIIALAMGSASARNGLSFDPLTTKGIFRAVTIQSTSGEVICELTLHVTYHRTVAKSIGSLGGQEKEGFGRCTGGSAGILVEGTRVAGLQGPYHLRYAGFGGTLPSVSWIRRIVELVRRWFQTGGITCLMNSEIEVTTTGGNPATGLEINTSGIPLEGGFLCSLATASIIGQGTLSSSVRSTLI